MVEENSKRGSHFIATLSENRKVFIGVLILSAILVGTINTLPHLIREGRLEKEGKNYHPYSLTTEYDMTNVIGPRIKEALEGNGIVTDIDLFEYKNAPWFLPPFAPLVFVPFGFFTTNLTSIFIFGDFIFSVLIFLLLFVLFDHFGGGRRWASLLGALFFSLYLSFAIEFPPSSYEQLSHILSSIMPFVDDPNASFLTRRESFVPAAVPLLLSLITLFIAYKKQSAKAIVFAGIFYALNAYFYPFHFIFVSSGLGVLFLISLFAKDWKATRSLIYLFFVAFVFLIPFFLNQIKLQSLPQYGEVFERFGIEVGRAFRWGHWERYLWILILSAGLWIWGRRKNKIVEKNFIISFLLAGILALNMQVILGFAVQSDHWLNRDMIWAFSIAYFVLFLWAYEDILGKFRMKAPVRLIVLILIMSVGVNALRVQVKAAEDYKERTLPAYYEKAFIWLSQNSEKDAVVVSPSLVSNYLIPLYTSNNIFIPRGVNTLAPDREILERLFIAYKLFGIKAEYLKTILGESKLNDNSYAHYEQSGVLYLFGFKFIDNELNAYVSNKSENKMPDEKRNDAVRNLLNYKCENCFGKYRADYIMVGPQERKISVADFSRDSRFFKVYDAFEVEIFKITTPVISL